MKDFPRFSEAKIQFEVTQPQMKLLMASVSFLIDCIDTQTSIDCKNVPQLVKAMQQHAMQSYRFVLPFDFHVKPENLSTALSDILIDSLQDAFYKKNHEFVERFIDEINKSANEIDPEIFNLSEGERLNLAYQGIVTCSSGDSDVQ